MKIQKKKIGGGGAESDGLGGQGGCDGGGGLGRGSGGVR